MGIVYLASNILSGKLYVGITIRSLKTRIRAHKSAAKVKPCVFYRAIRKYGIDTFEWSILEECNNENLLSRELFWSEFLNTLVPHGYNMVAGAGNVSDDVRRKMSIAASKRIMSEESKRKISAASLGNSYAKLVKRTPQYLEKLSVAQQSRRKREKDSDLHTYITRQISVKCANDGAEYQNMKLAARAYGIGKDAVRKSAQLNRKTKSGLQFEFVGEYHKKEYKSRGQAN
jgi:group I intron endonuclease